MDILIHFRLGGDDIIGTSGDIIETLGIWCSNFVSLQTMLHERFYGLCFTSSFPPRPHGRPYLHASLNPTDLFNSVVGYDSDGELANHFPRDDSLAPGP